MKLLSRDEVCPRSNLSLSLAGTPLDPLAELQSLKGLKPGAVLRLVEGISMIFFPPLFPSERSFLKKCLFNLTVLTCICTLYTKSISCDL